MLHASIDGAARGNPGPAGAGVLLTDVRGKPIRELAIYLGETTNNVAEYAALLGALQAAARAGANAVEIQTDSELLARQMEGAYRVKDPTLKVFHALATAMAGQFSRCSIRHVPREQNKLADRLANRAIEAALHARATAASRPPAPPDPSQRIFPFHAD